MPKNMLQENALSVESFRLWAFTGLRHLVLFMPAHRQ